MVVALFLTSLLVSNIIAAKLISVGGLVLSSAIVIFPVSYIIGDVLTEVYGYRRARLVIWIGFACNLLVVLIISAAIAMPPAPFYEHQEAFATVLGVAPRLMLASLVAYLVGEFTNSYVLAYIESRKATAVPAAAPAPTPTPVPTVAAASAEGRAETLTRLRQITAQRTTEAHQTIPHFYLTMEIDMEEALALRQRLNQLDESLRISVNDLIVKACAVAIEQHPIVNATYQNGQLVHPNGVHIGIAVAVEQGLLVAVLRHCEGKSLRRIAQESQTLIQKAREGKLMPDEMTGNTFTVSNLGMFGIEQFTAIINPPASAILAVGATKRVPVVQEDGTIVARHRMKVTLSCDHRVLDGAVGAQFLQTLKRVLENPLWMV